MAKDSIFVGALNSSGNTGGLKPSKGVISNGEPGLAPRTKSPRAVDTVNRVVQDRFPKATKKG